MLADDNKVDEYTVNAVSDIYVTRVFLQSNYVLVNTFSNVSLNSINEQLPCRLSQHALHKVINDVFPSVKTRRFKNDKRYNIKYVGDD